MIKLNGNSTGEIRHCKICSKEFYVAQWQIRRNAGLYCSSECYGKSKKGKSPWNKGRNVGKSNSGSFSKSDREWKGTISEYKALHYWVGKYLGKPDVCEFCKKREKGKKIHWANKSGKYKRDKNDWIRLCTKCHFVFDGQDKRRGL